MYVIVLHSYLPLNHFFMASFMRMVNFCICHFVEVYVMCIMRVAVPELQQHLDPARGEKMALAPDVMAEIVLAGLL